MTNRHPKIGRAGIRAALVTVPLGGALWLIVGRLELGLMVAVLTSLVFFALRDRSPSMPKMGKASHVGFSILFAAYVAATITFLVAGLWPAFIHAFPSFHQQLHELGQADNLLSHLARRGAEASHSTESPEQIVVSYIFSAISVGLGIFLVRLRPHDAAARLLATAMIGTAALFNLQAHNALTVLPILGGTLHNLFHLGTGVAYVLALMIFPNGQFVPRWAHLRWYQWPLRTAYVLFFVFIGLFVVENFHGDNPTGWVVFFGLLVPIAGISSQLSRYRHPATAVERQQSRILVWALSLALGATVIWVTAYTFLSEPGRLLSKTVTYELEAPSPGRYFFVCDPHRDMRGIVTVTPDDSLPTLIRLTARNNEFSTDKIALPSGKRVIVRFINRDGDAHNLAIYEDRSSGRLTDPFFVGRLFSAHALAELAFVVFPGLFAVIPTTLFMVLVQYRLWDMDRIVNRALVYTACSGILGATYLTGVVILQRALGPITQGSSLAVAGSTLAVAGLFRPVRSRIQGAIDRVFYRRKYNAEKTLHHFSARLRDEVDLNAVTRDLLEVVSETVQPSRVSLWLRQETYIGRSRDSGDE
ncbi:MAG: hypothetical protein H0W28_13080 [Pyrinomonadaceae bacterium]|nr:hypothetical protein [Pyrinomonadaceae bacterium]